MIKLLILKDLNMSLEALSSDKESLDKYIEQLMSGKQLCEKVYSVLSHFI